MNAPEPQGREVDIHMFLDSDHAGDVIMQSMNQLQWENPLLGIYLAKIMSQT